MRDQRTKSGKWLCALVLVIGLELVYVSRAYGVVPVQLAEPLVYMEMRGGFMGDDCPCLEAWQAAQARLCPWPQTLWFWYAGFVGFGLLVVLFDLLLVGRSIRSAYRHWQSQHRRRE